jgi:thioredoxin 1
MKTLLILTIALLLSITACKGKQDDSTLTTDKQEVSRAKVTFIELGSVNCIPCKQMQPIMKSIEAKYSKQVKVIFYDVWKDNTPAKKYNIQLIPTQVFLDENGTEFFRHEGFYPEEEIDKLLQAKGLKAGM